MILLKSKKYLCGILVILYIFSGCRQKSDEVMLAEYLIDHHHTSNMDSVEIARLVDTLLRGTVWQNKFQINKRHSTALVNIYIIDGGSESIRRDENLSQLQSSCSFAGSNIIFLDGTYLRSFLDRHHVIKDPETKFLLGDQECFLYWVIGHELGHFVCGHLQGDFEPASLDDFVKNSSLNNRQEMQADSFFVKAIVSRKNLRQSEQRLMMNILNTEIEQKVGKVQVVGVGIIYDYTDQGIINYARQKTHPEYVVRLARMLELSTKMGGDTGLYNLTVGFIKHLKEVH